MDNSSTNRFMDFLIGGVDQSLAGNGGSHCYTFRSDYRKLIETCILVGVMFLILRKYKSRKEMNGDSFDPKCTNSTSQNSSKQMVLIFYCLMMGIQAGFKFATRTLIFYFQPCHIVSTIQIYLLATTPNKYTSLIFRTHLGLLQGPLLALVFPVFDTYKLPFEIEMYYIQHYAILIVPVYMYLLGQPYSLDSLTMFWMLSYPVFILYHMLFLQPLAIYTGVNVSTILCPAPSDPFYGPNYILHAAWHQGVTIFGMLVLYSSIPTIAKNINSYFNRKSIKKFSENNFNGAVNNHENKKIN